MSKHGGIHHPHPPGIYALAADGGGGGGDDDDTHMEDSSFPSAQRCIIRTQHLINPIYKMTCRNMWIDR